MTGPFLLTEGYEELPVAPTLVGRQGEDTRHVVPVGGLLLLQHNTGGESWLGHTLTPSAEVAHTAP